MNKIQKLYEGKAKIVFSTEDPRKVIIQFKDSATAFNGQKVGIITGKGEINCAISTEVFKYLQDQNIATHFIERIAPNEMLVKKTEIIPVEVVMRNIAAGSLLKRLGLTEGTVLPSAVLEWYHKNDALGDPAINCDHISAMGWATLGELQKIRETAGRVNKLLTGYFLGKQMKLVDFKLEFGRHMGEILLSDEISPDGCRLWDTITNEKLDKDRFRQDLGNVEGAYRKVLGRIFG